MKHPVLVVSVALAIAAGDATAGTIREILIEENTKTTDETVKVIAGVDVGDAWDDGMSAEIKVALENSGLFSMSDVYYDPVAGGVRLHIIAKDKHSWIIAPTAYNQPTNKGGGLGFGENNLFGENKKLLLYGQIATGDSFFLGAYIDPSLGPKGRFHWQADVYLQRARVIEYEVPTRWYQDTQPLRISRMNYLNAGLKFGLNLWNRHPVVALDGRIRGAVVSYSGVELAEGASPEQIDPALTPGQPIPDPGADGWDVSSEVNLGFDTRATWFGVQTGSRVRLAYERGLTALGSDFDYWLAGVRIDLARKFYERHNLITRIEGNYGRNLPFQQELTVGGTQMRGYKNQQVRGNFRLQANFEYSVHLVEVKGVAFRALAFWDSAYIVQTKVRELEAQRDYLPGAGWSWEDAPRAPLRNSVGGGIRLYMRKIVLPLLGLDFGYGVERGDYEVYIAIGLTD